MRRKFAMRKRRQALARGAEFEKEEKVKGASGKKKDGYFGVDALYKGMHIFSGDYDELVVFSALLECMDVVDEMIEKGEWDPEKGDQNEGVH